jgi:hypothetical protein
MRIPLLKATKKVPTVNEESWAKAARHLSRLKCKAAAREFHQSNGLLLSYLTA